MNKKIILTAGGVIVAALVIGGIILFFLSGKSKEGPGNTIQETPEPTATPDFTQPTPTPSLDPKKFVCPETWTGLTDQDQDMLPDIVEEVYKTIPTIADTDGDGYQDGNEVLNGYDPAVSVGNPRLDSDGDLLLDNDECAMKTDHFNRDTDGDGYTDGEEMLNGYDPLIAGSAKLTPTAPPQPTGVFDPTASATPVPTTLPATPIATAPGNQSVWKIINASEIKKIPGNTSTDISGYLKNIDSISPQGITVELPAGLLAAFQGNPTQLRQIVTKLKQHEQKLLQVPVPPAAVEHHILFVSLVRYVNGQLTKIADLAGVNPEQQRYEAVQLQNKLSEVLKKINALKANLVAQAQ